MVFSSTAFLYLFLPVIYVLNLIIPGIKAKNILLLAASIAFYAFGEPFAVLLMLASIVINYSCGLLMRKEKHRKAVLVTACVTNIGLLVFYKYLGFLVSTFNDTFGASVAVPKISLPIGISFFTFQALSYVIDCYHDRELVQKNPLNLALYISFFPQLIAGPIVKYSDVNEQITSRKMTADKTAEGIKRFIFGFGKKMLVANALAGVADIVFNSDSAQVTALAGWVGAICYTLQIYFDFSGYSDMAIGLGKMFGFDFKENFNFPYASDSMQDFWRRWHISVSSWFKEYLYFPLGGNRKGKARTIVNKWIVFLCTGLWHGANLTFLLWGAIHGFFLMIESFGFADKVLKFKPLKKIYTLFVVVLSFVIFRADNVSQGFSIIKSMFSGASEASNMNTLIISKFTPQFIFILLFAVIFSQPITKWLSAKAEKCRYAAVLEGGKYVVSIAVFLLAALSLSTCTYNPFIYFRF